MRTEGTPVQRVRRSWIFYTAMMAIALGIGVLQMFRVPAGLLTDYGADVFGTAWLYAMFRQGRTVFGRGRAMTAPLTAVFVFTGCAVSEIAQAAEILPGVFDSFDLLAFAVSVAACYALDRHVDLGP